MKLIQVMYSLDLGGIEEYSINLGEFFSNAGHESIILLLSKGRDESWCSVKIAEARKSGINVIDISINGKFGKMFDLTRTLCRLKPDFVIIHHELNAPRILPAKLSCGFRVVQVQHSTVLRGRIRNKVTKLFVNKFVCPSNDVRDALVESLGVQKGKIKVIENGIKLTGFSSVKRNQEKITILAAGRFVKQKNYVELAEIFKNLIDDEKDSSFEILWAGEGETWQKVRESCRNYSEIVFTGSVLDIKPLFGKADIYVSYSLYEGLSLTLLEAMASGCAIVSTRTGGTSEAVEDNVSGVLVDVGDSKAFLHELKLLAANRERINVLGEKAALAVRKYDFENTGRAFVGMMDELYEDK